MKSYAFNAIFVAFLCTFVAANAEINHRHLRNRRGIPGGPIPLDKKEANEVLSNSLLKLSQGDDGPYYKIGKIYSATTQVVAGKSTKIDADLIGENNEIERCTIKIWSRPWISDGNEVTIECANKPPVVKRHSRSVEYLEKKPLKKHVRALTKKEVEFKKFQKQYNRNYTSELEYLIRFRIFRKNLKIIKELNEQEQGSAKYGITEFADMMTDEYKLRTGLLQRTGLTEDRPIVDVPFVKDLPKEFDWRERNAVTTVKNQGNCGSCWAFSVTGNIEGLYAVQHGELKEFSEQELLDCDTVDSACNGGLPDDAYKAIKSIGGLEFESEYPYKAKKQQCKFNRTQSRVQVKGFVDLPLRNETAMQHWLVSNGPISIGINANAMQFYRGGVSHPWGTLCSRKNIDHGVLIVGYGISEYPNFHKSLPYWIVKNSWGPKWGEKGYYRVYRGDNTCGVAEMVSSAMLA